MGQRFRDVILRGAAATAMSVMTWAVSDARAALVAHYDFNESSGPTLNDSAGTANGTTNNVAFGPSTAGAPGSDFGNAGSFDGTSSGIGFGTGAHPATFDLGAATLSVQVTKRSLSQLPKRPL